MEHERENTYGSLIIHTITYSVESFKNTERRMVHCASEERMVSKIRAQITRGLTRNRYNSQKEWPRRYVIGKEKIR